MSKKNIIWAGLALTFVGATPTFAASAPPGVDRGWPVPVAAPATVFAGKDGSVIAVGPSGEALGDGGNVVALSASGKTRWRVRRSPVCTTCSLPTNATRGVDGVIGPIGRQGASFWGVNAAGGVVDSCRGVIGSKGECFEAVDDGGVAAVRRRGVWVTRGLFGESPGAGRLVRGVQMRFAPKGETVYVAASALPSPSGEPTGASLNALDTETGAVRWTIPLLGDPVGLAVADDGTVVVAERDQAELRGFTAGGVLAFRSRLPGTPLAVSMDRRLGLAYVETGPGQYGGRIGTLSAFAMTGARQWAVIHGLGARPLAVGPDGIVYISVLAGPNVHYLRALNPNGGERWTYPVPATSIGVPAFERGRIVLSIGPWLYRLNPRQPDPAAPKAPRLVVGSRAFRLSGGEQRCVSRTKCNLPTPFGAIVELQVPASIGRIGRVSVALRKKANGPAIPAGQTALWSRPGSNWIQVTRAGNVTPPTPGRYFLTASWRDANGASKRLATPVTIV